MTNLPRAIIKKFDWMLLTILALALLVRLYGLSSPLADWHSWRQADTAMVAKNFVRSGFDMLHPKFDDLSNIQSGLPNPQGYRFVEFPIYNAVVGALTKVVPVWPLEVWGRLTSIFFSLILLTIIYDLLKRESGPIAAISGALVFTLMPFFIYYSRVVLPDMTAISLMFIAIWLCYRAFKTETKNKNLVGPIIISSIFVSAAILIKPTTIFYGLVFLYLFYVTYGTALFKRKEPYIFAAIALIPFVLWRQYMQSYPEGIPLNVWLITSVQTATGRQPIFFRPAFFRWIFFERLVSLIFGGYMIIPFVLGVLKKQSTYLFYIIGLSSLAYLLVFQGGNVQHDYYQIMILPALAIFAGLGIQTLLSKNTLFPYTKLNLIVVIACFVAGFIFSGYTVRNYYEVQTQVVQMAQIIKKLTPPGSLIVTDRVGDTTLLYLADRRGLPAVTHDLEKLKSDGMQYFVTSRSDVAEQNKEKYELIFENSEMFLFKL